MQALTGLFARQFGTPNYAAHGGFCSVNMAAGMIYTIGGSFWEFGGPDLERAYWRPGNSLGFRDFIENIPFYGFAVLCADHPEVRHDKPHHSPRPSLGKGLINSFQGLVTHR